MKREISKRTPEMQVSSPSPAPSQVSTLWLMQKENAEHDIIVLPSPPPSRPQLIDIFSLGWFFVRGGGVRKGRMVLIKIEITVGGNVFIGALKWHLLKTNPVGVLGTKRTEQTLHRSEHGKMFVSGSEENNSWWKNQRTFPHPFDLAPWKDIHHSNRARGSLRMRPAKLALGRERGKILFLYFAGTPFHTARIVLAPASALCSSWFGARHLAEVAFALRELFRTPAGKTLVFGLRYSASFSSLLEESTGCSKFHD